MKLAVAFFVVIAITSTVGAVSYYKVSVLDQTNGWTIHTFEVMAKLHEIVAGLASQESAVRGYLVSGDSKYLDTYQSGQTVFQDALAAARSLTADNAAQTARLDEVGRLAKRWQEEVAGREIALMGDTAQREQARALMATGAGKMLMDPIRALVAAATDAESALLGTRSPRGRRRRRRCASSRSRAALRRAVSR